MLISAKEEILYSDERMSLQEIKLFCNNIYTLVEVNQAI